MDTLAINHVKIGDRHRKDLGDLGPLVESIDDLGLLHAIVVDGEDRLVAGHRRLEACRKLGWQSIPVRRVRKINDAVTALKAERDENTCRLDFAPSEAVALGLELERLIRPEAEERRKKGQSRGGKARHGQLSDDSPETSFGDTRAVVAPAVGMGEQRYQHAKNVVEAQDDPDPKVAEAAREAVDEMDRTGNVSAAHRKVKAARGKATVMDRIRDAVDKNPTPTASGKSRAEVQQRIDTYKRMAAEGYTSRQIAAKIGVKSVSDFRSQHDLDAPPADSVGGLGRTAHHDANRIVEETAISLDATAMALDYVDLAALDVDRIDGWAESISESLSRIRAFKKRMAKQGGQE